jgi:hypothetical protein
MEPFKNYIFKLKVHNKKGKTEMEEKSIENYYDEMKKKVDNLINLLNNFDENSDGRKECTEIARLTLDLGVLSNKLRVLFNNYIPVQIELLDYFYKNLNVDKLTNLFCVAILRNCYLVKDDMTQWYIIKDKMIQKMIEKGDDPKSILRNLYDLKPTEKKE